MGQINRDGHPNLDQKWRSGFWNLPGVSRLSGSGSPDLLENLDFWSNFLRLFKTNRDKSGKVEEIEKCRDISAYPHLSWLFPTYLDFSWLIPSFPDLPQLFPTFPSTNLGYYSQKIRQYQLSRYSKSQEKLGNREKLRLSQLVSVEILPVLTWPKFLLRPSQPNPDLSQSRDRPSQSRSWPNLTWFWSRYYPLKISRP